MDLKPIIRSQYHAALEMLKRAIVQCPAASWDDETQKNRFWHVAYHALFYTHLYLQPSESDFVPWSQHREHYQFMGPLPWPPHQEPEIGAPYSKDALLAYLEFCQAQVQETVASLDPDAASGFDWLPMGKLELQFYNIRHLQQHVGELCERLGATQGIEVGWVGMQPGAAD